MEHNKIIKALEICITEKERCRNCPYYNEAPCILILQRDALALIKELTEENERLKLDVAVCGAELSRYTENIVQMAKQDRADTVRKMQERLDKHFCHDPASLGVEQSLIMDVIEQIAKEMLEGEK